jgi:hypothetical protein
MYVEHLAFVSQDLGAFLNLCFPTLSQLPPGHAPMANVTVGAGDEFHMVPKGRPLGTGATSHKLTVIRVCAESDDAQFAVGH